MGVGMRALRMDDTGDEPGDAFAPPDGSAAARYDAQLRASRDLDGGCTRHAFVTAAFLGLQPGRRSRVYALDGDTGHLAFAEREAYIDGTPRPLRLCG